MELKRVLVVDDEEDLTWSISKHLAKDKDKYDLIAVNSGVAALDVLSQLPVELVISDIRMPEISGLDLLLKIRENYPTTKVIIMTAYGSSEIQQEANKRGCFKYIEKPFEIQEMRQLILNAVEDKKGFEGRISDFQLSDLIQMNCLGRLTNALQVSKNLQHGVIYFEDGNIVHTSVDNIEGEDAFYEILTWQGGTFAVEKGQKAQKETIFKGWQTLLLEGMRRADEKRNKSYFEQEAEEETREEQLIGLLNEFVNTKGFRLAAVLDSNGQEVASAVDIEFKNIYTVKDITAIFADLLQKGFDAAAKIELKTLSEILFEYKTGILRIIRLEESDEYFSVIADRTLNLSLLRMESKKFIKRIMET